VTGDDLSIATIFELCAFLWKTSSSSATAATSNGIRLLNQIDGILKTKHLLLLTTELIIVEWTDGQTDCKVQQIAKASNFSLQLCVKSQ